MYALRPTPPHIREVSAAFTKVKTVREAKLFLEDILTPKELQAVSERWQIFKLLAAKTPHRTIQKRLNVSIATITRGSHAWSRNHGGIPIILKRMGAPN